MGLVGKLFVLALVIGAGFMFAPQIMGFANEAEGRIDAAKAGDWQAVFEQTWSEDEPQRIALEEAWGVVDGGSVVELQLTFAIRDANVTLDMAAPAWTADGQALAATTHVLRDRDGSIANGTANIGDLWTVTLELGGNWGPNHEARLVWYPESDEPLAWKMETPSRIKGDRVAMNY